MASTTDQCPAVKAMRFVSLFFGKQRRNNSCPEVWLGLPPKVAGHHHLELILKNKPQLYKPIPTRAEKIGKMTTLTINNTEECMVSWIGRR